MLHWICLFIGLLWVVYLWGLKFEQCFFLLVEFCQISNFKKSIFWRFSSTRNEKIFKNCQIHILGFHCVVKNIEKWLRTCILFLVYSQILLNFPRGDCHFSYKISWKKHYLWVSFIHVIGLWPNAWMNEFVRSW